MTDRTMVPERHTSAADHHSCVGAGESDLVGYSRSTSTASPPKPPVVPLRAAPDPVRRAAPAHGFAGPSYTSDSPRSPPPNNPPLPTFPMRSIDIVYGGARLRQGRL